MSDVTLAGCRPEPLGDYLKALGIVRLIGEQADPKARGYWRANKFVLSSSLNEEQVIGFFLEDYQPTPLISPWNGGSGFYPKDNTEGPDAILATEEPRFESYRETLRMARSLVQSLSLNEKPADEQAKKTLLKALRSRLSDLALQWLDAALVLGAGDEKVRYAPLLGTGGNDGRLEFSNNFMKRLAELFLDVKLKPKTRRELLGACLFDNVAKGLQKSPVGQYDPGAAGGPNQSTGFDGPALINPCNFVLMLEGSLMLAAAAVRRYRGSSRSGYAFPFTVTHSAAGHQKLAGSEEEGSNNRNEIWLPLWDQPASIVELRALFQEGRAQNGLRQANNPVEFTLALASLGTARGLSGFTRFAFLQRNGKSYFATPLGYHPVRPKPDQAALLRGLDSWFRMNRSRFRDYSNKSASLIRRYESAVLDFFKAGSEARFCRILESLGEMSQYLGKTPKLHELVMPVPWLTGRDWYRFADDGTTEFRLAAGLASLGMQVEVSEPRHLYQNPRARFDLEPINRNARGWNDDKPRWVGGDLPTRMLGWLRYRLLEANKDTSAVHPLAAATFVRLTDVQRFVNGEVDDARLERLLFGLALVQRPTQLGGVTTEPWTLPLAYSVARLAYQPLSNQVDNDKRQLGLDYSVAYQLSNGRQREALLSARRILFGRERSEKLLGGRWSRKLFAWRGEQMPPHLLRRVAASLLFPVSHQAAERIRDRLFPIEPRKQGENR